MKYYKRLKIYKAPNVTFNPETLEAFSYEWWKFVAKIEGKIVFNNYSYSQSTSKHQIKVRRLLDQLGIKIDISMPLPNSIDSNNLNELILKAEECLCDQFLDQQLKRQDAYQRAKRRKFIRKLEDYLENTVHFRDYEIKRKDQFGSLNIVAVHQIVEDIEADVSNALHSFHRDGFSKVVFYA